MRVLFSGGGTIGSVSPLIAIYEEINSSISGVDFLWLATKNGPEDKLLKSYQIPVKKIYSGKLRRYFSWRNFLDPFFITIGFFQALIIIRQFKPSIVMSAGGFVAVPVTLAAWLWRCPVTIHQQDIRPGLANRLMAPFATIITVAFEKSLKDFPPKKTVWVGNPVRADVCRGNRPAAQSYFKLDPALPTVLIVGGGTGARELNNLVINSLPQLVQICQIIHLTGGKLEVEATHSRYHSFDFLADELKDAYAAADLVVTRAGMSVLTEIAALQRPAIIIPIPHSHQEDNAVEFFRNNAAAVLQQEKLTPDIFFQAIKKLLADKVERDNLSRNVGKMLPTDAAEKIIKLII